MRGVVVVLPSALDDAALTAAVVAEQAGAARALFDRHGSFVQRIIVRTLGPDAEVEDILHEVFIDAFASLRQLRDPTRLRTWLARIAVGHTKNWLRSRRRRRWWQFLGGDEVEHVESSAAGGADAHEAADTLRRTYAVLAQLPDDERLAFCLRFVDDLELTEGAAAVGVSLATYKRRVARAKKRFETLALRDPALADMIDPREGGET